MLSIKNLITLLLSFNFTIAPKLIGQNFWEETNGPEGGLVQCLALGKDNSIYAGFKAGQFGPSHSGRGLYKSENFGQSWNNINLNSNKDIQSIAVDTSGTIFIWVLGAGVFKSTNNGMNWTGSQIGSLSDGVLVSFNNNYLALGKQEGVYISTNNGTTWNLSSLTDVIYHLYVDNLDNIFASTYYGLYKSSDYGFSWTNLTGINYVSAMADLSESVLLAGTYNGVYKSSNGGITWSYLAGSPIDVTSLSVDINRNINVGTTAGFFVSDDKGNSWYKKDYGLKCKYITSIQNLPANKIMIGTFGDGLFVSSIEIIRWNSVNSGIKSVSVVSLYKYKELLFAGSEQGIIYKSSDNGNSWRSIDSVYTQLEIRDFISSINNSLFFCNNNGIFKSTDEGETWFNIANLYCQSFTKYFDHTTNTEYLFVTTGISGVYRSSDNGTNWLPFNNGLNMNYATDIVSNSQGYIFVAHDKIFMSTNLGQNWENVPFNIGVYTAYNICLSISQNDFLYAGFDFGGLQLSTNNGENWIDLLPNLPLIRVNSIATDPLNRVYAGNWNGAVYQSGDFGQHWNHIHSGLIGGPILNLLCDNDGNIFVGPFGGGVYRGIRNTFIPPVPALAFPDPVAFNLPLNLDLIWYSMPTANIYNLQVSTNNSFDSAFVIYNVSLVDTMLGIGPLTENTIYYWRVSCSNEYGTSLWSPVRSFKTMKITSVEDSLSQNFTYGLTQNYPNPFNPTTSIQYTVSSRQFVTLKVYDVLGREVATLINEEKQPGVYEVEFIAENLSSGVYYYQLKAGSYLETRKMIILK